MKSQTKIVARYAETDQMGIVHHSVYPIWFEVARTDWIKKLGKSYTEMEQCGIMLPLAELRCRYYAPVKYEDAVTVTASVIRLTAARVEFGYEVILPDGTLACKGSTLHGWTGTDLRPLNLKKRYPEYYQLIDSAQE